MALKSGRVGIHPSQVDPITGMLIGGGPGGASIDDNTISKNTTWSSDKINTELATKANVSTVSEMYASINENAANILQLATNKADRSELAGVYASINAMALTKLVDVEITDLQDGDYLIYDGTEEKFVNSGAAPGPSYTDVTVTIYGAVEDTISFTDAAGISHSVTFTTNASSSQETFKIDPSGSSITFTSAVAKDPENLSNSYTKTISITSGTTDIYVMPSNTLYWYGYELNGGFISKQPSNMPSGFSYVSETVTKHTNYMFCGISGASKCSTYITSNYINIGNATSFKILVKDATLNPYSSSTTTTNCMYKDNGNTYNSNTNIGYNAAITTPTVFSGALSDMTNAQFGLYHQTQTGNQSAYASINIYAMWLE